ncbi:MAG: hypothetical protein J0M01_10620 [Dechloromonas sp.]|nr:hypothetical protein [Dechloromonas sp.]
MSNVREVLRAQRDAEVAAIANSYIVFNGQQNQRRWDSTFIGEEFLHNNNESMLAREDLQSGTREFFFFINDRLWKRFQARRVPPGGLDFATFAASLEGLFGPGLHRPREGAGAVSGQEVVLWQSGRTRLRVFDQSQFHSVFCLVYEEKVLADHMAEVRRERAEREAAARRQTQDTNQGAPVEDRNEDVVDRITGQSRATPSARATRTRAFITSVRTRRGSSASGRRSCGRASARKHRVGSSPSPGGAVRRQPRLCVRARTLVRGARERRTGTGCKKNLHGR